MAFSMDDGTMMDLAQAMRGNSVSASGAISAIKESEAMYEKDKKQLTENAKKRKKKAIGKMKKNPKKKKQTLKDKGRKRNGL